MLELKHAGIVKSTRGAEGGYALARPAEDISVADVIRAVDGPLANVRGERVETVEYDGAATSLRDVWVAVRASLRRVLESTSLQDVVEGELPDRRARADQPTPRRGSRSTAVGARRTAEIVDNLDRHEGFCQSGLRDQGDR